MANIRSLKVEKFASFISECCPPFYHRKVTIEKAFENAVNQASKSVNSIQSAWADDVEAVVEDNKIKYKVNAKITFVVN